MGQVFDMWHITAAFNSGVAQREVAYLYSKCFWNSSTKENLFILFTSSCHSEPILILFFKIKGSLQCVQTAPFLMMSMGSFWSFPHCMTSEDFKYHVL